MNDFSIYILINLKLSKLYGYVHKLMLMKSELIANIKLKYIAAICIFKIYLNIYIETN